MFLVVFLKEIKNKNWNTPRTGSSEPYFLTWMDVKGALEGMFDCNINCWTHLTLFVSRLPVGLLHPCDHHARSSNVLKKVWTKPPIIVAHQKFPNNFHHWNTNTLGRCLNLHCSSVSRSVVRNTANAVRQKMHEEWELITPMQNRGLGLPQLVGLWQSCNILRTQFFYPRPLK